MADPAMILDVAIKAQGASTTSASLWKVQKAAEATDKSVRKLDKSSADYDKTNKRLGKGLDDTTHHLFKFNQVVSAAGNAVKVLKFPTLVAGAGLAASAIGGLTAGVIGLTSALGPLAGLLPAVASGYVALGQGLGVVKLAFSNVSAAMKGNTAALAKLTPAQKTFVDQLKGMKGQFDGLKQAAAAGLFPGLNQALKNLTPLFGPLKQVIGDTGKALGDVAAKAGKSVGGWGKDLKSLGENNVKVIGHLGNAAISLGNAFKDILVAAEPLTLWLAKLADKGAKNLEVMVHSARQSGELAKFFDKTKQVVSQLGDIFKNLAVVLFHVFKAAEPLGKSLLGSLDKASKRWANWSKSIKGQNVLQKWFKDMKAPLMATLKLFADLGKAFVKLTDQPGSGKMITSLGKLIPMIQQFITSTLQAFGPAIISTLTQIARLFVIFAGSSGPLVIVVKAIGGIAKGIADLLDKGGTPLKVFLASLFGVVSAVKLIELAIAPFKAKWLGLTSTFSKLSGTAKTSGAAQEAAGAEGAAAAVKATGSVDLLAASWDRVTAAAERAAAATEAAAGVTPGGKLGGLQKVERTAGGVILPPSVSAKALAAESAAEEKAVEAATASRFTKFQATTASRLTSFTSKLSTVAERATKGVGIALGGILATQIGSQLVGGKAGKWISAIGTGASAGAGIGSLFGPEGTIGGAIIGALGSTLIKALGIGGGGESKAEKAARAYAKQFGEDMANAVSTGIPGGLKKADEKTLAQSLARAQRLRQNARQAAQQARPSPAFATGPGTGLPGGGPNIPTFGGTPTWLSGYLKGAAQRQDIKSGMKVAQDWMKGFASVKYKDAGTFVASASASIANLPKFARGEAGMMITQFAEQLIAKKQLPPKALKQVFDGMLSNVPGLRKAFAQQGILTDQDLARSFKLQKARSTLQDSVNWIQHTFGNVVGSTKVDGDNMAGGFEKATRALKQAAARNVGAAHDLAVDKLHDVQKQGSRYAAMLATQVGSSTSHMRNQIKKNVGGAADDATLSFATMFGQIGGMIQAGTVTMNKGVTLIANALNAQLTAFGAAKIPLPVLKTLSLKGLLGEQQFALHGAAGTGTGGLGNRGARGMLMQIGQYGQGGSDSVPLNVGGTPITVAPGEQVAVFNRHQLPVVNNALAMSGYAGLPGLFSQIQTPNYMAKGGMVGGKGLKMAAGGTLSYGQLEGLWIRGGGPKVFAPTAAAIALAESGGRDVMQQGQPFAKTGWGYWQITPGGSQYLDPLTNARAAVSKWVNAPGGGHNFSPWTTYTDGAYRAFLHGGVPAVGGIGANVTPIKAPRVGGKGTMSRIVQAGLNKATRAANAKLRREAAKFAPVGGGGPMGQPGGGGLGTFDGIPVANWIVPELNWARAHGWGGRITAGWSAGTGHVSGSEHYLTSYPGGAIDVGDQFARGAGQALWDVLRRYPGNRKLIWAGNMPWSYGGSPHDYGHFSGTGHARGGLVGRARGFARGGLVGRRGFAGGGLFGGARSFARALPRAGTAVRAVAAAAPVATAAAAPSGSSSSPSKAVPNPVIPKIPNALTVLSIPQKMTADVKHVQHLMRDAEITGELITQAQVVHDALQPFGTDQSYTSGFITTDAHGVSSADLPAAALETTYLLQQKTWWNQIVSDYKQALHLIHSLIKRIKTLRTERRKQIRFMRNRIRDNIQAVRGYTRNLTHIQAAEKKLKPKQKTAAAKQKIIDKFGKIAPDVLTATISALGAQNKAFGSFTGSANKEITKLDGWLGTYYGGGQGGGDVETILGKIGYAAFLKNGTVPTSSVAAKTGIFGQVPTVGGDLANALLQATLSQDQANQITPAALGDAVKKANAALFSQQAATTAAPSFDISRLAVAQASLAALSPSSFLQYAGAFAKGGVVGAPFALVGENGPELAQLPIGTRVHPSSEVAGAAQTIHVHIHDGAVDASKIQVLAEHAANVVIRREVRSSMLPTPGRGGLGIR